MEIVGGAVDNFFVLGCDTIGSAQLAILAPASVDADMHNLSVSGRLTFHASSHAWNSGPAAFGNGLSA
jgi:hypothetical protein